MNWSTFSCEIALESRQSFFLVCFQLFKIIEKYSKGKNKFEKSISTFMNFFWIILLLLSRWKEVYKLQWVLLLKTFPIYYNYAKKEFLPLFTMHITNQKTLWYLSSIQIYCIENFQKCQKKKESLIFIPVQEWSV